MRIYAIVFCLLLAACDMITLPWKISRLKHEASQSVICEAGKDCDVKWARALKWVKRKSKLGIAAQTDSLIKTGDSRDLNSDVAFTITKVSTGGTGYRIDYEARCDDDFGCTPPLLKLHASFVEFVNGNSEKIK